MTDGAKLSRLFGCLGQRWPGLRSADEAAGESTRRLPLARDDLAGDQGGDVAIGALDEAAAATRQVVHDLGRANAEAVIVDHIDVCLGAAADDAAVVETNGPRVVARQTLDGPRQRQTRAARAVARPVRQHVGDGARIREDADMRTSIAKS